MKNHPRSDKELGTFLCESTQDHLHTSSTDIPKGYTALPGSPSHIQHQRSQTTNTSLKGRARAEAVAQTPGAWNVPKNRGLDTPQHRAEPEQGTGSTGTAPLPQRSWLSEVRSQENAGPKFFTLFSPVSLPGDTWEKLFGPEQVLTFCFTRSHSWWKNHSRTSKPTSLWIRAALRQTQRVPAP